LLVYLRMSHAPAGHFVIAPEALVPELDWGSASTERIRQKKTALLETGPFSRRSTMEASAVMSAAAIATMAAAIATTATAISSAMTITTAIATTVSAREATQIDAGGIVTATIIGFIIIAWAIAGILTAAAVRVVPAAARVAGSAVSTIATAIITAAAIVSAANANADRDLRLCRR
jgi:hypothetical protein